jgi:hypothetical protein
MVVVKHPVNAEASGLLRNACNFARTLDAQFLTTLIRRGYQNFNSNVRPDRRTLCAKDQGAIQSDVVREAPFRALHTVIPVENDGESKFVSN